MKHVWIYFVSVLFSFFVCAVLQRIFIPVLKSRNIGQHILTIGPRWHKSKEGTPTMGGIFIMLSVLLSSVFVSVFALNGEDIRPMWITLISAMAFGAIGIVDDVAKLRGRTNEGLTPPQKMLCIVLVASAYVSVMALTGNISTDVYIPFFKINVPLGNFFYPIAVILICGIVNSVNLTDGIDGLAATVTSCVTAYFSFQSVSLGLLPIFYLTSGSFGACLGFLVYNAYPAKIFMGDTGSLFFGGLVCGFAFAVGSPFIILICGIVYVFETLTVILQVSYYKLTHGKRLFKMSPFHHHLERSGWSENNIVLSALLVTLIFSSLCLFLS